MRLKNSLSSRLTLYYGTAFLALLGFSFVLVYLSINSIMNNRMDEDLEEDLQEMQQFYSVGELESLRHEIDKELAGTDNESGFIRVIDYRGEVIYSSDLNYWNGLDQTDQDVAEFMLGEESNQLSTRQFPDQEEPSRMILGKLAPGTIIQIGESTEDKSEIMETLLHAFSSIFLLGIPLSCLVSWFFARRAARDIVKVSIATQAFEQGKLETRVAASDSYDEVNTLASTFNSMAGRIQQLITEMREMIDNLAHDLRSPVTRIRAMSEQAISGSIADQDVAKLAADTINECDRLIRMINNSLDVAELEAGITERVDDEINICHLIAEACELYEAAAEEKNIELTFRGSNSCMMQGNQQNLQRMFANLLDNALKYSPENTQIYVVNTSENNQLNIKVSDQGIGIPASEHQRVFDRFYRCDQSRGEEGCGLGLSFSRAVARAHGGDITVHNNQPQGSNFLVSLPLS